MSAADSEYIAFARVVAVRYRQHHSRPERFSFATAKHHRWTATVWVLKPHRSGFCPAVWRVWVEARPTTKRSRSICCNRSSTANWRITLRCFACWVSTWQQPRRRIGPTAIGGHENVLAWHFADASAVEPHGKIHRGNASLSVGIRIAVWALSREEMEEVVGRLFPYLRGIVPRPSGQNGLGGRHQPLLIVSYLSLNGCKIGVFEEKVRAAGVIVHHK